MRKEASFTKKSWIPAVGCAAMFAGSIVLGIAGCGFLQSDIAQDPDPEPVAARFTDPQTCGACHATHYREWQGSIMHYAAVSPVFNAFELTMAKLTEGGFSANGTNPNFCIGCHSPTGVFNGELPDFADAASARPARDSLSPISQEGVSCDFCHTVSGPDLDSSLLQDGIANVSVEFAPSEVKFGPFSDPAQSPYHESSNSEYIQSAEFCGGCHDVRIPVPDVVTGEPFQRLENLFTEWQQGPYNSTDNPYDRIVRCQDCHMSLYPQTEPGIFPTMPQGVAVGIEVPERPHAIHAFTAVSVPFIDDPRFPNVDTDAKDDWGFPLGQQQRREQMLRAACTLTLEDTPDGVSLESDVIPVRVVVENVGAGHKVPSGFSQEREVWIELVVEDDAGIIYESGYLRDQAHPETGETLPDGLLDDEDLNARHFTVDIDTLDTEVEDGPDRNQRPDVNLGLMNFQNEFIRFRDDGSREVVLNPLLAETMNNNHSLDMLQPKEVAYDVPMPQREIVGNIRVSARLRYRAFPPKFLRILAVREPDLVTEEIVDRNTIVDMAGDQTTMTIR